jgi:hypothetical protein
MTALVLVTESGEQHGLINVLANSVQDNGFKYMNPENKTKCEKLRKEESKKVKARYLNHRGGHERLTKPYCRWAGDPIQMWHFIPGYEYEVPYGLVKEVNEKKLPQRGQLVGIAGKDGNIKAVDRQKDGAGEQIHEFVPVGW